MKHMLLGFYMFVSLSVYGHDTNVAFFTLTETENAIEISAEFPWTIRDALFDAFPRLETTRRQAEIDSCFFLYVRDNLIIKSPDNDTLTLISVIAVPNHGHDHGIDYQFVYNKKSVSYIINSLMFNINKNQKNYINFLVNGKTTTVVCTPEQKSHKITTTNDGTFWSIIMITLLFVVTIVVIVSLRKKRHKNEKK